MRHMMKGYANQAAEVGPQTTGAVLLKEAEMPQLLNSCYI